MDDLHTIDIYKCLFSLGAGVLLGMERELKDKAAGVKTISIICLGATLFSIISLRFSPERATAMAAYIVSGVGFLGAGVIFKDGINISGLTTASIIWMSAAIGTSIGFGEFYMSGIFLVGSFLIILVTPWLNQILDFRRQSKLLTLCFPKQGYSEDNAVLEYIRRVCKKTVVEKTTVGDDTVELVLEIFVEKKKITTITTYLLSSKDLLRFTL